MTLPNETVEIKGTSLVKICLSLNSPTLPKKLSDKAIRYTLAQWEILVWTIEEGRYEIDQKRTGKSLGCRQARPVGVAG